MSGLQGNRTLDILEKAEREGYGILAQTWYLVLSSSPIVERKLIYFALSYDGQMAVGLVRAAERSRSPAILQLFPVTLAYGKGPFLRYCLELWDLLSSLDLLYKHRSNEL